jgi:hypothetical protein
MQSFRVGVEIFGPIKYNLPLYPEVDFLNVDFHRIIGFDDIIIHAGR